MDGLSGAASVISVVSLAIQLAGSVKKLLNFWESVQNAPDNVKAVTKGLRVLSVVLDNIEAHQKFHGEDQTTTELLDSCRDHVTALTNLIQDFEPGFASQSRSTRQWIALKAVFKKEQIQKFQHLIQETKITLIMAQQNLTMEIFRKGHGSYEQEVSIINEGIKNLQLYRDPQISTTTTTESSFTEHLAILQSKINIDTTRIAESIKNPIYRAGFEMGTTAAFRQVLEGAREVREIRQGSSPTNVHPEDNDFKAIPPIRRVRNLTKRYNTTNENLFCRIYFDLNVYHIYTSESSNDLFTIEYNSYYRIRPSWWLMKLGLKHELELSIKKTACGWQQKIRVFYPVPDDSLIFDFIRAGDIQGVQSLLYDRKASVWDTNTRGETPLHIAARSCNAELCKLLLHTGADATVISNRDLFPRYPDTPLAACIYNMNNAKPRMALATLHILRESWDMTEEISAHLLERLAETVGVVVPAQGYEAVLTSTFDFLLPEIKTYLKPAQVHDILWFSSDIGPTGRGKETTRYLFRLLRDFINAPDDYGYTVLHKTVAACVESTIGLMVNGANLHVSGENYEYTYRLETPTSLAIRSSPAFFAWKRALRVADIDLTHFIQEEMKTGVLGELGWSSSALLELFNLEFEPYELNYSEWCVECGVDLGLTCMVELQWLDRIEEIRLRHTQAYGIFSRTSAMNSVEDFLDTGQPVGNCQSQNDKDAELPDEAMEDNVDVCSSRDGHSAASKTKDGENSQYEEMSEDDLSEPDLLCWHCWYSMSRSSDSSQGEDSYQDGEEEDDSPFLFSI